MHASLVIFRTAHHVQCRDACLHARHSCTHGQSCQSRLFWHTWRIALYQMQFLKQKRLHLFGSFSSTILSRL